MRNVWMFFTESLQALYEILYKTGFDKVLNTLTCAQQRSALIEPKGKSA